MASSPSPSEDNHKNKLQDTMSKALDRIMANTEQSYDDFVNSFTYLKKNDVLAQKTSYEPDSSVLLKKTAMGTEKLDKSKQSVQTQISSSAGTTRSPHDDLDTVVLTEGGTSSRLSQSKILRTGASIKVDNFVDSEDVDDDTQDMEEVHTEGYTASFSAESGQQLQTRNQTANQLHDSAPANEMAELFSGQLSLDENSTDKLLMNFLADLQNETNEKVPVNKPVKEDCSQDIQNFLNKKMVEKEEVTFSDEEGDSAADLLDNSEKGSVKVVVKPEELVAIESDIKTKPVCNIDDVAIDSEGKRIVYESQQSKSTVDEIQEDQKNVLFPGEAENTDDNPGPSHESMLDFKALRGEPSSGGTDETSKIECSNTVEPFQLDKDFDYDHVVLTPKYSQEDMRRLRSLVTQVS